MLTNHTLFWLDHNVVQTPLSAASSFVLQLTTSRVDASDCRRCQCTPLKSIQDFEVKRENQSHDGVGASVWATAAAGYCSTLLSPSPALHGQQHYATFKPMVPTMGPYKTAHDGTGGGVWAPWLTPHSQVPLSSLSSSTFLLDYFLAFSGRAGRS